MKEIRTIGVENLRNLCINCNLYTRGNSAEYSKMLNMAADQKHLTTEKIVEIAKNILNHSNTDIELTSLCFTINKVANTFFIEE